MTPRQFKITREKKQYSQSELAREFTVDVGTISRWERKVIEIPRIAQLALLALKPRRKGKGKKHGKRL